MTCDGCVYDVVVVGAGPAGLAAAWEAAKAGARVALVESSPWLGGQIWKNTPEHPVTGQGRRWLDRVRQSSVTLHMQTTVVGTPASHTLLAETPTESRQIQWHKLIVATGARERFIPFPGWTLPGVLTAGAAQTMINVHRVLPGHQAVIIGIDPLGLAVAQLLVAVGAQVSGVFLPPANGLQAGPASPKAAIQALAEYSAYAPGFLMALAAKAGKYMSTLAAACFPQGGLNIEGFPLMLRRSALSINGSQSAETVEIAALSSGGQLKPGSEFQLQADTVITSSGLSPLVELAQLAGCPLHYLPEMGGWVPLHSDRFETPPPGLFIAGSISGVEGAGVAEIQGRIAGLAAADYLKLAGRQALKRHIPRHQKDMIEARQAAIPFYPQIEAGRARMNRLWNSMI